MRVDVTNFDKINVIDTCSIWNLLSSNSFYSLVQRYEMVFSCTQFVVYECLFKKRKSMTEEEKIIRQKLIDEQKKSKFSQYQISIEDLQSIEVIRNRKKLSMGELSSIVFAKKTRQSFITDDQGARRISEEYLGLKETQTIPQLLGWLTYCGDINDHELDVIVKEHTQCGRLLEKYFREAFLYGLEQRLIRTN